METKIPGIRAKHCIITEACRSGRGEMEAFDEAVRRIRKEYEACAKADGNQVDGIQFHLVLTVDRPDPAAGHGGGAEGGGGGTGGIVVFRPVDKGDES